MGENGKCAFVVSIITKLSKIFLEKQKHNVS